MPEVALDRARPVEGINANLTCAADVRGSAGLEGEHRHLVHGRHQGRPLRHRRPKRSGCSRRRTRRPAEQRRRAALGQWPRHHARRRGMWIIDFRRGHPRKKPRSTRRRSSTCASTCGPIAKGNRETHGSVVDSCEPRPPCGCSAGLDRYIGTPSVAKHRLFVWLPADVLPDPKPIVFAREDDYFFGVLHSRAHEVWALGRAPSSRAGRATRRRHPSRRFRFRGRRRSSVGDPLAAVPGSPQLVEQRDRWLNPEGASEVELKRRTLTNLYNARPAWLRRASEAGRSRARRLRLAARPERRGDPGTAAGAQPPAGGCGEIAPETAPGGDPRISARRLSWPAGATARR